MYDPPEKDSAEDAEDSASGHVQDSTNSETSSATVETSITDKVRIKT